MNLLQFYQFYSDLLEYDPENEKTKTRREQAIYSLISQKI